ncbi:MAG TPA: energy transducer TonB, partial [Sphingobacterium sp.]|nr:energy transducer TonB [Sphingobacterium sp.]
MLFSKSNIYAKDWLDTIFAGRNKDYGAYELRQLAPRATNMALGIVTAIVVGICGIAYATQRNQVPLPPQQPEEHVIPAMIDDRDVIEIETPVVPPPPETAEQPQQVAQDVPAQDVIKFTEINATDISNVHEDMVVTDDVLDKRKLL